MAPPRRAAPLCCVVLYCALLCYVLSLCGAAVAVCASTDHSSAAAAKRLPKLPPQRLSTESPTLCCDTPHNTHTHTHSRRSPRGSRVCTATRRRQDAAPPRVRLCGRCGRRYGAARRGGGCAAAGGGLCSSGGRRGGCAAKAAVLRVCRPLNGGDDSVQLCAEIDRLRVDLRNAASAAASAGRSRGSPPPRPRPPPRLPAAGPPLPLRRRHLLRHRPTRLQPPAVGRV